MLITELITLLRTLKLIYASTCPRWIGLFAVLTAAPRPSEDLSWLRSGHSGKFHRGGGFSLGHSFIFTLQGVGVRSWPYSAGMTGEAVPRTCNAVLDNRLVSLSCSS